MKRKVLIALLFAILSNIPIFAQQPLLGVRRSGVTHKFGLVDLKNNAIAISNAGGKTIAVRSSGATRYARVMNYDPAGGSPANNRLVLRTKIGLNKCAVLPYVCSPNAYAMAYVATSLDSVFVDNVASKIAYSPYNSKQFWLMSSSGGSGSWIYSFGSSVLEIASDNAYWYAISGGYLYRSSKSGGAFSTIAPAAACKTFFGNAYYYYNGVISRITGSPLSSPNLSGSNYTMWCVDNSNNIFWPSGSTLIKGNFSNANVASVALSSPITGITCIRGRDEALILVIRNTARELYDVNLNYLGEFRYNSLPIQMSWLPFVSSNNSSGTGYENHYYYCEGGYVKQCSILQ